MGKELMKAYKGFNRNMTCNGFQYEEGKTYETDIAECCVTGFHACENPIDCLNYYPFLFSEYHEVECEGEINHNNNFNNDSKLACTKIKIGKKISIFDMVNKFLENIKKETNIAHCSRLPSVQDIFGSYQISTATGINDISHTFGYDSISCSTGRNGIAYSVGAGSCSASTDDRGISMVEGIEGISSATGEMGSAVINGEFGISCTTGIGGGACVENENSIAVAWGEKGRAKGVIGSYLVLTDRLGNDFNGAQMVRVDGEKIKADTWYMMMNGKIVDAEGN